MASSKSSGGIGETFKTIFWALLLAGIIRTLFFQPFWIPSGSMKSTLLIGDFLFVNKMAYGYSRHSCPWSLCPFSGRIFASEPEQGDVVVFKHPVNGSDYIKRLIGLPGDTVQMKSGQLYINGQAVPNVPDDNFDETFELQGPMGGRPRCISQVVGIGKTCSKESFRETLPNGVQHTILNIANTNGDNTALFHVPEGNYFFMGDNRDNSTDSRFDQTFSGGVGMVPFENIVGRANRVIFSSAGKRILYFWTWRSDRFFKRIE